MYPDCLYSCCIHCFASVFNEWINTLVDRFSRLVSLCWQLTLLTSFSGPYNNQLRHHSNLIGLNDDFIGLAVDLVGRTNWINYENMNVLMLKCTFWCHLLRKDLRIFWDEKLVWAAVTCLRNGAMGCPPQLDSWYLLTVLIIPLFSLLFPTLLPSTLSPSTSKHPSVLRASCRLCVRVKMLASGLWSCWMNREVSQ